MAIYYCSQCGQQGHNSRNRECLVNLQKRVTYAQTVRPWVRTYPRMSPEDNVCRRHISEAIVKLDILTQFIIRNRHIEEASSEYVNSAISKINEVCEAFNTALEHESMITPILITEPITDYIYILTGIFNRVTEEYSFRMEVSIRRRKFQWSFLDNTVEAPVKRTSEYLKEISLVHDFNIPSSDGNCPLCFDEFAATDLIVTNCNHSFCGTCIKGFADSIKDKIQIPNCPMCRTDLTGFKVGNQQIYEEIQEHILNL